MQKTITSLELEMKKVVASNNAKEDHANGDYMFMVIYFSRCLMGAWFTMSTGQELGGGDSVL